MDSVSTLQMRDILELVQQPGFCISADGQLFANQSGRHLCPSDARGLPVWLGDQSSAYEKWDGQGILRLQVRCLEQLRQVTIKPLTDGTLFLLEACSISPENLQMMEQIASFLHTNLSTLTSSISPLLQFLNEFERYDLQANAASVRRAVASLKRLTGNMNDLRSLYQDTTSFHPATVDVNMFLTSFVKRVEQICNIALTYQPLKQSILVNMDAALIERALYNLLSNAIQHRDPQRDICLVVFDDPNFFHFQMSNYCTTAQFNKLCARYYDDRRGSLSSGAGIGLSLVQAIARLHGGSYFIEATPNQMVTVTLSLSRKIKASPQVQQPGITAFNPQQELADVLPTSSFIGD